jgi:phosphinothricin acetyltransferase
MATSNSILIRHADAPADAGACAEIYAPFVRGSAVSFEQQAPGAAELTGRIERISRTHPWLVAVDGGAVAGFAYAATHRERAAYCWAADVTVYVHAGHRRRGIGQALYRALLELLVRQGLYVACAGITLPNDASVALHESLGFQPVGVYRRIGFKAGAWRDVGWWQLALAAPGDGEPTEPGPPARLERA